MRTSNPHPRTTIPYTLAASGVYFYRLEGSAGTPRKMVLLK